MAPLAYGALASIAGMVVISTIVGVLIGAVVWRLKHGLAWGFLCVVAYLLLTPPAFDAPLKAAMFNAPPLILTFLSAYLTGCRLRMRGKTVVTATMVVIASGLLVGLVFLLLFRALIWIDLLASSWIALVVDVFLATLAIRQRKFAQPISQ